jgi:hypothetical protein
MVQSANTSSGDTGQRRRGRAGRALGTRIPQQREEGDPVQRLRLRHPCSPATTGRSRRLVHRGPSKTRSEHAGREHPSSARVAVARRRRSARTFRCAGDATRGARGQVGGQGRRRDRRDAQRWARAGPQGRCIEQPRAAARPTGARRAIPTERARHAGPPSSPAARAAPRAISHGSLALLGDPQHPPTRQVAAGGPHLAALPAPRPAQRSDGAGVIGVLGGRDVAPGRGPAAELHRAAQGPVRCERRPCSLAGAAARCSGSRRRALPAKLERLLMWRTMLGRA